jgi:hypothetical protein
LAKDEETEEWKESRRTVEEEEGKLKQATNESD